MYMFHRKWGGGLGRNERPRGSRTPRGPVTYSHRPH